MHDLDTGTNHGSYTFRVSHAWTQGPMMHVVYQALPLEITWGLARDTRRSLIDPGPWNTTDEASLYYLLLDFEEGLVEPRRCANPPQPSRIQPRPAGSTQECRR